MKHRQRSQLELGLLPRGCDSSSASAAQSLLPGRNRRSWHADYRFDGSASRDAATATVRDAAALVAGRSSRRRGSERYRDSSKQAPDRECCKGDDAAVKEQPTQTNSGARIHAIANVPI
jgi:hypothetical protein